MMTAAVPFASPGGGLRPTPWRQLPAFLLEDPFVCGMFLSLLLIGADRFGIQAAGLTLRLVFPLLMAAFGLLYLQRANTIAIPERLSALFFLLAIAGAVSTINSLVVVKSVGYTIWVFFDFFIIITLCYNLARLYAPEKILSLWFLIFRIHVFLVLAEIALSLARGRLERPYLWFYESSYMAIFLTGYFGSSLYMFLREGKPYALDFALSALVLLVTASATGMFGIVFSVMLNFIVARQRLKLFLWTLGLTALFFSVLYYLFSDTVYYQLVGAFFLNGGQGIDTVLGRAGDRWVRVLVGWGAFLHSPWTGVGIGGDSAYMDATPIPDFSQEYIHPWTDLSGQPFCNIFVEVLGTMGIVGFIPFISILGYSAWQGIKLLRNPHPYAPVAVAFFMGFFCSILAMQMEGTMLRYYLWSPLGLAMGVLAQIQWKAIPPAEPEFLPASAVT